MRFLRPPNPIVRISSSPWFCHSKDHRRGQISHKYFTMSDTIVNIQHYTTVSDKELVDQQIKITFNLVILILILISIKMFRIILMIKVRKRYWPQVPIFTMTECFKKDT